MKPAVSEPGLTFLTRPWFIFPVFPPLPPVLQESEGGLYICMNTFLGFGKQYVERHFNKTGQRVYLHLRRTQRPVGMGWSKAWEHADISHLAPILNLCSVLTFYRPQFPPSLISVSVIKIQRIFLALFSSEINPLHPIPLPHLSFPWCSLLVLPLLPHCRKRRTPLQALETPLERSPPGWLLVSTTAILFSLSGSFPLSEVLGESQKNGLD